MTNLRSEIETLLIAYDGGGYPDPHIDDWVRLIDRERQKAVEEALEKLGHLSTHGSYDDDSRAVLAAMFPSKS